MIENKNLLLYSAEKSVNAIFKAGAENAHKVKRFGYPYDYAFDYGTHYNWISLDQVKISEKSENQRKNYKSELEGKNIAITLLEILNIVKEYYDMV